MPDEPVMRVRPLFLGNGALEAALDRASGRKTRILQLLAEAGREQTTPTLVEFAFGAPGVPRHEEAGDED